MRLRGNAAIAHGGGPTAVLNSSLAGVYDAWTRYREDDTLFGAVFGIQGILKNDFVDLSRAPDPDRAAKAIRYATLMAHSKPFSVAAAFSAKLREASDETAEVLRTYSEDLIRELRAGPSEARAHIEDHWTLVLSLCSLILGTQETDLLRRRGKVPTAAIA